MNEQFPPFWAIDHPLSFEKNVTNFRRSVRLPSGWWNDFVWKRHIPHKILTITETFYCISLPVVFFNFFVRIVRVFRKNIWWSSNGQSYTITEILTLEKSISICGTVKGNQIHMIIWWWFRVLVDKISESEADL